MIATEVEWRSHAVSSEVSPMLLALNTTLIDCCHSCYYLKYRCGRLCRRALWLLCLLSVQVDTVNLNYAFLANVGTL